MADREERGLLRRHADNARLGDILETRGCRRGKFSWFTAVHSNPPDSAAVVETFWRRCSRRSRHGTDLTLARGRRRRLLRLSGITQGAGVDEISARCSWEIGCPCVPDANRWTPVGARSWAHLTLATPQSCRRASSTRCVYAIVTKSSPFHPGVAIALET
jgi:hypothetical protein